MSTLEITHPTKAISGNKIGLTKMLVKTLQTIGRKSLYFAAAMTPQPAKIEVRMSDGSVLRNIPSRVWERHSALISASYDSQKRNRL
jgi:hypothetical protein